MLAGTRLLSVPAVQLARRARISRRVSAAASTLETATKQNVGAAASKSQTHVGLNSGHLMPLFGWGTSGVKDAACVTATKSAIELGYRVSRVSKRLLFGLGLSCCYHMPHTERAGSPCSKSEASTHITVNSKLLCPVHSKLCMLHLLAANMHQ